MKDDFRVGFVGVGRMGANMARCLKDHGYTVTAVSDLAHNGLGRSRKNSAAKRLHHPPGSLNVRTPSSPS